MESVLELQVAGFRKVFHAFELYDQSDKVGYFLLFFFEAFVFVV
jgi:hypothetical protein